MIQYRLDDIPPPPPEPPPPDWKEPGKPKPEGDQGENEPKKQ